MELKIHTYLILRGLVFNQMLLLVKLNILHADRRLVECRTVVENSWNFKLRYICHEKHSEVPLLVQEEAQNIWNFGFPRIRLNLCMAISCVIFIFFPPAAFSQELISCYFSLLIRIISNQFNCLVS